MEAPSKVFTGSDQSYSAITVASWNIAAVNNNPFEYWITSTNPAYNDLMIAIQDLIESPDKDVQINTIFTDQMFSDLCEELEFQNTPGLEKLEEYWFNDYRNRFAIGGFLKDKSIGTKRLASMPDRITNTINLHDGALCRRPTAINAYDGPPLTSLGVWWTQWKNFMFHTYVKIAAAGNKKDGPPQLICSLIGPILRSKYPAISIEEQVISVPLQILCLALLDAIFVYLLNRAAPTTWEPVRRELCEALVQQKTHKVLSILAASYLHYDVIFLQEAAAIFTHHLLRHPDLSECFHPLLPYNLDGKRDQNSLILVSRRRFDAASAEDVTDHALAALAGTWAAPGDLAVASVRDRKAGRQWLLASFHGDGNGLSTQPLLASLNELARTEYGEHFFLIGLDANTHSITDDPYLHTVAAFDHFLAQHGMLSLWGSATEAVRTTCGSRTYLQPQLNKAVPFARRADEQHRNLKDWIVGYSSQVEHISSPELDNTGHREHVEGLVLPTLHFPSDHAIISAVFHFSPVKPDAPSPRPRRSTSCKPTSFPILLSTNTISRSGVCSAPAGTPLLADSSNSVTAAELPCEDALTLPGAVAVDGKDHGDSASNVSSNLPAKIFTGTSGDSELEIAVVGDSGMDQEQPSTRRKVRRAFKSPRSGGGVEATLYDYWGLTRKPMAASPALLAELCLDQDISSIPQPPDCTNLSGSDCAAARSGFSHCDSVVGESRAEVRQVQVGTATVDIDTKEEDPEEVTVEEEVARLARRHMIQCSLNPRGEDLDGKSLLLSESTDRSVWILFSTRPLTLAVSKFWAHALLLGAAVAFALVGAYNISLITPVFSLRANRFRLTALHTRNGSSLAARTGRGAGWSSGVSVFGLLRGGCTISDPHRVETDDTSMVLSFKEPVAPTGWFIETGDGDPALDPVAFAVEWSNSPWDVAGGSWTTLVPPAWLLPSEWPEVPEKRRARQTMDLRPTVEWVLQWCIGQFVMAAGCLVALVLARAGQYRAAARAIGAATAAYACVTLLVAVYNNVATGSDRAWADSGHWVMSASTIVIAMAILRERYVLDGIILGCLLFFAALPTDQYLEFLSESRGGPYVLAPRLVPILCNVIPVCLGLALRLARHAIGQWALGDFVRADRDRFDHEWAAMQAKYPDALRHLCDVARRIAAAAAIPAGGALLQQHAPPPPAHMVHAAYSGLFTPVSSVMPLTPNAPGASRTPVPHLRLRACLRATAQMLAGGQLGSSRPALVESLDQLYLQAAAADILLRDKVVNLAKATRGCLRISKSPSSSSVARRLTPDFDRIDQILPVAEPGDSTSTQPLPLKEAGGCSRRKRVRWAGLKPKVRSLEKLLRSYDGAVPRLLDVCRQQIVFESLEELVECLEALADDPDIQILRVKNRMDPECDGVKTAGFRNVTLNLRIQSLLAQRLHVHYHVCELQLTHRCFAELVTQESHARYLALRNCRDPPSLFHSLAAAARVFSAAAVRAVRAGASAVRTQCGINRPEKDSGSVCRRSNDALGSFARIRPESDSGTVLIDSRPPLAVVDPVSSLPMSPLTRSFKARLTHWASRDSPLASAGNLKIGPAGVEWDLAADIKFALEGLLVAHLTARRRLGGASGARTISAGGPAAAGESISKGGLRGLIDGGNTDWVLEGAVAKANSGGVWDTSRPVAAALCKPWLPRLLWLCIAALIANLWFASEVVAHNNVVIGHHYRFTPLETRAGGPSHSTDARIGGLGLLINGCSDLFASRDVQTVMLTNGTWTLSFATAVAMNGWWFATADTASTEQNDPVRFRLDMCATSAGCRADEWLGVGSSTVQWTWAGAAVITDGLFPTSLERNYTHRFNLAVPTAWRVGTVVGCSVALVGLVSLLIMRALGYRARGTRVIAAFLAAGSALQAACAAAYYDDMQPAVAMVAAVAAAVEAALSVSLVAWEKRFRHVCGGCGVAMVAAIAGHYAVLGSPGALWGTTGGFENPGFWHGIALLGLSVTAAAARAHSRARAGRIIAQDQSRYDLCWRQLLENDAAIGAIPRLFITTAAIARACPQPASVRQRCRSAAATATTAAILPSPPSAALLLPPTDSPMCIVSQQQAADGRIGGQIHIGSTIEDLDQLMAQARGLDPLLRVKVREWGLASNGYAPLFQPGGSTHLDITSGDRLQFVQWADVFASPALAMAVRWAHPKTAGRAVEKVFRCYGMDCSRLLDCCRQAIYFDCPAAIETCVRTMASDPEVKIVRVNNRLHPGYPAAITAGYRDVALSLRLDTQEARSLGIEMHVCEVQLVLIDFAKIKSNEGHARYVVWRNYRGT